MKFFISGMPGSGKTSLVMELINELKKRGKKVVGLLTPEIRDEKSRKGFWIVDIATGQKALMASKDEKQIDATKGIARVASYVVSIGAIEKIVETMKSSIDKNECIAIIDEIGKMELCSRAFEQAIKELMSSNIALVATLHRDYVDQYKKLYKDAKFLWLTRKSFSKIKNFILGQLTARV
jgi:nucleoside-triphosphatase THEP1